MRLLHSADLHLDSPLRAQALKNPTLAASLHVASRTALARLIDAAIAHGVDALLLAGDIFDNSVADVTSRAALAAELGRLGRANIPAVLIRGNHDALLDHDRYGPLGSNVTLLTRDAPTLHIQGAAIHGLSFDARHMTHSTLPEYPAPEPGRINVGMMHTSLNGAAGHDPYAPCALADLLAHGYDYWALGHIHKRGEYRGDRALAVMPGIPQGRSIREPGLGSATLVEIDSDGARAREVPVALLGFAQVALDLSSAATQGDQIDRMADALRTASIPHAAIALRLTLRGAGTLAGDPAFARELAQQAADQVDGAFVEALRFDQALDTTAPGVLTDLAAFMADAAATPGFRDEAAALLADWRKALPRDIADVLAPEALDELITEGIDGVVARLTPKGSQE